MFFFFILTVNKLYKGKVVNATNVLPGMVDFMNK